MLPRRHRLREFGGFVALRATDPAKFIGRVTFASWLHRLTERSTSVAIRSIGSTPMAAVPCWPECRRRSPRTAPANSRGSSRLTRHAKRSPSPTPTVAMRFVWTRSTTSSSPMPTPQRCRRTTSTNTECGRQRGHRVRHHPCTLPRSDRVRVRPRRRIHRASARRRSTPPDGRSARRPQRHVLRTGRRARLALRQRGIRRDADAASAGTWRRVRIRPDAQVRA